MKKLGTAVRRQRFNQLNYAPLLIRAPEGLLTLLSNAPLEHANRPHPPHSPADPYFTAFASFADLAHSIAAALPNIKEAVLDGEIVCLDKKGRPRFNDLLFRRSAPCFFAFDLLHDGRGPSQRRSRGPQIGAQANDRPILARVATAVCRPC